MKITRSIFLIRGLPGSGKSTLAHALSEDGKYPLFSVDDYFTDPVNGKYLFEYDRNHLAYKTCLMNTENAMGKNTEKIFIANTFTMDWEMEPYFKLASGYKYMVFVVTVENRHGSGDMHGVSREQIIKMAKKYKVVLY